MREKQKQKKQQNEVNYESDAVQTMSCFLMSFSNPHSIFGTFIDDFRVSCEPFQPTGEFLSFV